ncbi:hypothetical protein SB860_38675, partial [Burkholderia sp. SIMBA_019]
VYVPYVNSEKLREIQQIRFHLEGMGAAEAAKHITRKQLDNLIAQEASRQTATDRTMLVSLERAPRLDALQRELAQVGEALKTAP